MGTYWRGIYTFEVNGGNTIESIKSDMLIELPTPTKEGYYFGGWYDNVEFNGTALASPYYSSQAILFMPNG